MKHFFNTIKFLIFVIVLVCSFLLINDIYSPKSDAGIYALKQFYKQKQDIDVICIGTSNVYNGIDSGVLWSKYGIASYNLASGNQVVEYSYLMAKEAIRKKKPKLIIMDMLCITQEDYRPDINAITYNATMGMWQNKNRIEAIYNSYLPENKKMDYYFKIPIYHNRSDFSRADFYDGEGYVNWENTKGYYSWNITTDYSEYVNIPFGSNDVIPLRPKTEKYLRKIINLCKENDVKLYLIKTPIICASIKADRGYFYKLMNAVEKLAKEEGVYARNYNSFIANMDIDVSKDFADELHLNFRGAEKFTELLADDIKKMFNLPDRRGQEGYQTYDIISENYARTHMNHRIRLAKTMGEFVSYIVGDSNMFIGININGDFTNVSNLNEVNNILEPFNLKIKKQKYDNCFVYTDCNDGFKKLNKQTYYNEFYPLDHVYITFPNTDKDPDDTTKKSGKIINNGIDVHYNKVKLANADNGISFFVYDYVTQVLVENSVYEINEDNELILEEDEGIY